VIDVAKRLTAASFLGVGRAIRGFKVMKIAANKKEE
jgi:hypothetical protein